MNQLAAERSPYLLQHAGNPVAWHPWGEEAFARARREDKPVFLSIGYSTCHWCHVMERESFEDPKVADLMNSVFVSIKVDREERPDLDEHYLAAAQMLTGSGGWPLTILMTPDGEPFYAATYLPRESAYGRLGMLELVPRIGELWRTRRAEVLSSARSVAGEIGRIAAIPTGGGAFDAASLERASEALAGRFDAVNGGFGDAPKFPMATVYPFLLRSWKRSRDPDTLAMVEQSLAAMRAGGIFDQLGFGFHRYSTDDRWLVPHFEKMLYDQALLALAFTETWQATGNDLYRRTAREVFAYVLRDLRSPEGAFFAAEDADSEGEEGKFYLWRAEEARESLGGEAFASFGRSYGIREGGNFMEPGGRSSGANILHRQPGDTSAAGEAESVLLAARDRRARPFRDDTVLADWNGLMIASLARAGAAFEEPALTGAAETAAAFVLARMRGPDGRLRHRFRSGEAGIPAFADDYAFLAWGLLELYGATFDARHLEQAVDLVGEFTAHFWDAAAGGFFQTADDAADSRTVRRKPIHDGVLPSANSAGLLVLARLAELTGRTDYRRMAERIVSTYPGDVPAASISFGTFLAALDLVIGPSYEVVAAGNPAADDTKAMLRELRRRFLPRVTVILRPTGVADPPIAGLAPFAAGYVALDSRATAYVCQAGACRLPTTDIQIMLEQLGET